MIGRIYKLTSEKTNLVYIGSTVKTLKARLSDHKSHYKIGENRYSKCIVKYLDCKIELIKNFVYNDIKELRREEGKYQLLEPNYHGVVAGRTKKELRETEGYYKEQYQKDLQRNPNHNQERYKKALQKNPNYNEERKIKVPCDNCGKIGRKNNLARHKKSLYCKNFKK